LLLICAAALGGVRPAHSEEPPALSPYRGEYFDGVAVDSSSLQGKVLCGYQGWFTAEGDGADKGWAHYGRRGRFEPGNCSIDLWPDVSELDADEKFLTRFHLADGSPAYVFSSHHRKTVLRHFQWMQHYGIDGVFVQRFVSETAQSRNRNHCNTVLVHCYTGANLYGRTYALMYDLSGLQKGQMHLAIADWKMLVDQMQLGRDDGDRAYLHDGGQPVVAVWGVGFNDGRQYTLEECDQFIRFLKEDPKYGGNKVMLGVPTGWRTLDGDSIADAALHDVILHADIISPWTVGRYDSPRMAQEHAKRRWARDMKWCEEHGKQYMPVVFPGFSWHNMKPEFPLNQIPRLKGDFLWTQFAECKRAGGTMIYLAMFDEMDEGTAIFKCTSAVPVGESQFVDYEGLPSDHYLWLTGMGARMLRGEIELTDDVPQRY